MMLRTCANRFTIPVLNARVSFVEEACKAAGQELTCNYREGYDHSYYFITSFIEDHVRFHKACLDKV